MFFGFFGEQCFEPKKKENKTEKTGKREQVKQVC